MGRTYGKPTSQRQTRLDLIAQIDKNRKLEAENKSLRGRLQAIMEQPIQNCGSCVKELNCTLHREHGASLCEDWEGVFKSRIRRDHE